MLGLSIPKSTFCCFWLLVGMFLGSSFGGWVLELGEA
jgi:hypothetical protein